MRSGKSYQPRLVKQVMVSSTFMDLLEHRLVLIDAINANGFSDNVMENDTAKPGVDVLESSLKMVRDSSAYVAVIGRKYGQVPKDKRRNPDELSLTELEFREAVTLGRPILLFIIGKKHKLEFDEFDIDPAKIKKLEEFREYAKKMGPDSDVHRVHEEFDSLEDFTRKAGYAISNLRAFLDEQDASNQVPTKPKQDRKAAADFVDIPAPPGFYAYPPYAGSHSFVGRKEQLELLNEWAAPSDSHPVLLFEAIGGSGKSMLTWEWATKHARNTRSDWAGILWYSFYEKGATMNDFCRHALAYMTGQSLKKFEKKKIIELAKLLTDQLNSKPWLIILDGLERVLVSYHRFDAAQVRDEEAGLTDMIINRDPCSAIKPEDDELLRTFAILTGVKVLISSRLMPRIFLNASRQPIPGVRRILLEGLKPSDAEDMIRTCGVSGNSKNIQNYLKSNCGCHPLVIGVLAGLINNYLPDRGNFDAWESDPSVSASLNLAELDLTQRRNHILRAALVTLPTKSIQLLSTLSLLSSSVNFEMLNAFNPHLPELPPKEMESKHQSNKHPNEDWLKSKNSPGMQRLLTDTIDDLEKRGLIQYDRVLKHYDLHPVVRGVVLGSLNEEEKENFGRLVIDYFSRKSHNPYSEASKIEELGTAVNIMKTWLHMKKYYEAFDIYWELHEALLHHFEEFEMVLSLLHPFCTEDLLPLQRILNARSRHLVSNQIAFSLQCMGQKSEALKLHIPILKDSIKYDWYYDSIVHLRNIAICQKSIERYEHIVERALKVSTILNSKDEIFISKLRLVESLSIRGLWKQSDKLWEELNSMSKPNKKNVYRQGDAESSQLTHLFRQNKATINEIDDVIKFCKLNANRFRTRRLLALKGEHLISRQDYIAAIEPLQQAIQMSHEIKLADEKSETLLAIARFHTRKLDFPLPVVEKLGNGKNIFYRGVAELWTLLGNDEKAKHFAFKAHAAAWGEGEPYVNKYELDKSIELLEKLGLEIPTLPPFDRSKIVTEDWEIILDKYIENLEKETKSK